MSESDVLAALEELDFGELIPALRDSLEGAPSLPPSLPPLSKPCSPCDTLDFHCLM